MTSFCTFAGHSYKGRTGPGFLDGLRTWLSDRLDREHYADELKTLVLLAVEEAAANIEEHGYRSRPGMPVTVCLRRMTGGCLEVSLSDRCLAVRRPGRSNDLLELAESGATRGRGLAIVRLLTQTMRRVPRPRGGSTLTLVFNRRTLRETAREHLREAA